MDRPADAIPRRLVIAVSLVVAAGFVAAYGQAPLYYSNQNQYFLHGLAQAGHGFLRDDWLARTLDPTPVFTALVAFTAAYLHPWLFYAYHALMLGAYAVACLGLFDVLAGRTMAARRCPLFALLLVLVHSAAARWCSYRLFGQDYPWYFQAGVAGQYVLGAMFQPSVFGVLLVLAVCLFARGRPLLAAVCSAAAVTVHPTYALPAALLVLGFVTGLALERRFRLALATGALALVLVLPTTVHALLTFGPTSAEAFAEAEAILVNVRIPHHTRPDLWLDPVAAAQIAWMVLGVALTWRTRLFPALTVAFALGTLLTMAQVVTGSHSLALLFPWRVSSVLLPVATVVVLSRLASLRVDLLGGAVVRAVSVTALAALAAVGLWISFGRLAFLSSPEEEPLLEFVRQTRAAGDVYFVPFRVPDLVKSTRGSLSSDFKPMPDKKSDARVIPPDLLRFRLATGAPIYVDFKSIPYKDVEVIEWRERVRQAAAVQGLIEHGQLSEAVAELRRLGVTHLVWRAEPRLSSPDLQEVPGMPKDSVYRVYRVSPK